MIVKQTLGVTDRWHGIVTCAEGGQQRGARHSETQTNDTATPATDLSETGRETEGTSWTP